MTIPTLKRFGDRACTVTIGDKTWFYSYDTCVAFSDDGNEGEPSRARRQADYSATTGKHMAVMNCRHWLRLPDKAFERFAGLA